MLLWPDSTIVGQLEALQINVRHILISFWFTGSPIVNDYLRIIGRLKQHHQIVRYPAHEDAPAGMTTVTDAVQARTVIDMA
ncbi:hypothetical protein WJ92_24725 [Burkholderia ubonensis]|nr:hypothetical protein WJ92_24725 [Burkholderia ubonensis]OJA54563.1 hypothetical protein BGV68_14700 [Burkholderia ubonensis]